MIRVYFREPSCSTASLTRMYFGLPSTTSAGLRAISNATTRSRHYTEDIVLRPTVIVAGLGRLSALLTVVPCPVGASYSRKHLAWASECPKKQNAYATAREAY